MAIEFRCATCNALLRVPDDRAGKLVRCPHCQGVMMAVATEPTAAGAPNPFADLSPVETNPYAAPKPGGFDFGQPPAYVSASQASVKARLQGPAIGMIVAAALGIAMWVFTLVVNMATGPENVQLPPAQNEAERMGQQVGYWMGSTGAPIFATVLMLVILYGAWKMMRAESYGWAMTAAILSLFPCTGCCILGAPFGIWALVVLNDASVRACFSAPPRF
jgi:DNA-directed RNA polymerase subunit RPC12/RpoP